MMRRHRQLPRTLLALVGVFSMALPGAASGQSPLSNGDFADGLEGWTVGEHGGGPSPGGVQVEGAFARLTEGDSFLVGLSQSFLVPEGLLTLSFTVDPSPGLDTSETSGIPDTFEVHLLSAGGGPAIGGWRAGATAFFNLQETGPAGLGAGVTWADGTVTVDASGLAAGSEVILRLALVGGDRDFASSVLVGGFGVTLENLPPVAAATGPESVECGAAEIALDGAGSSDPDEDALSFAWTGPDGAAIGDEAAISVPAPGVGVHTYTLVVSDGPLSAETTVTVTVVDTAAPEIAAAPAPAITVAADSACEGEVPALAVVFADGCVETGALTVTQQPPAGTALVLGEATAVSVVGVDPSGNQATFEATVILVDNQPPSFDPPTPLDPLPADGACQAAAPDVTGALVATDNCPGAPVVTQDVAVGAALALGETPIALTVTDGAGNVASTSVVAVVEDTTAPEIVAPEALVISADGACAGEVPTLTLTLTDNCSEALALGVAQDPPAGAALTLGLAATVAATVTDAAGNSATASTVVTLVDTTAPEVLEAPAAQELAADAACEATLVALTAVATDNCTAADALLITQDPPVGASIVPADGAATVTLSIADAAGNAASAEGSVSVVDTTPPSVVGVIEAPVIAADAGCSAAMPALSVEVSDNCTAAEGLVVTQDPPADAALGLGAAQVTITVADATGNTATAETTATVADESPPVVTGAVAPAPIDADGSCEGQMPALTVEVTDNCTPVAELVVAHEPAAGAVLAIGDTAVVVTASDGAGNQATADGTASVVDTSPPVFAGPLDAAVVEADASCAGDMPALEATVTDNCTPAEDLVVGQSPPASSALMLGEAAVVVTATDAAGNSATAETTATLVDTTAPTVVEAPAAAVVIADASCAGLVPALAPVLADNCAEATALELGQEPAAGAALALGPAVVVTITATDPAGNTLQLSGSAALVDETPPVAIAPEPVLVSADEECSGVVGEQTAQATDNCTAAEDLVHSQQPPPDTALSLGSPETLQLQVQDAAGNAALVDAKVSLVDVTPPAVTGVPDSESLQVVAGPACEGPLPALPWQATDNCAADEELTAVQEPAAGAALTLGAPTAVTITVQDGAGNESSAGAEVSLVDQTPPEFVVVPPPQIVTADSLCQGVVPTLEPTVADNCTAAQAIETTQDPAEGAALVLNSETAVALTATDGSGNTAEAGTSVTLENPPDHSCEDQPGDPDKGPETGEDQPGTPDEGPAEADAGPASPDAGPSSGPDTRSGGGGTQTDASAAAQPPEETGGCGCRQAPDRPTPVPLGAGLVLLGLLAGWWVGRRRRVGQGARNRVPPMVSPGVSAELASFPSRSRSTTHARCGAPRSGPHQGPPARSGQA